MVPWHLQPKYSNQSPSVPKSNRADSAKAAARRAKKAEKQKRKSERRENIDRDSSDACDEVKATSVEVQDEASCFQDEASCFLLGELQELCVEEIRDHGEQRKLQSRDQHIPMGIRLNQKEIEPLQDHCLVGCPGYSKSDDTDESHTSRSTSGSDELVALGYKTFQRYYHVFRCDELTKLFSLVAGVRVMEEFYDHENWCVLAEKQSSLQ